MNDQLSIRVAWLYYLENLTQAEIGERLVITRRTAEHHVQDIYARIGVSSRAAAALYTMEHDLLA